MYRREFDDQHAIEEAQQEDLGAGGSQCPGEMVDEIINFRDFLGEAKIFGDPKNNNDPNTSCFFCCRTDSYTCDACDPRWDEQKQQVGRQENSEIQRRYEALLSRNGGNRDHTYQQYWQYVGMPPFGDVVMPTTPEPSDTDADHSSPDQTKTPPSKKKKETKD